MGELTIPIYNTIAFEFVFIFLVAVSVIESCIRNKDFDSAFYAAFGLVLKNLALCFIFAWLAQARTKRFSGDAYLWMMDSLALPIAGLAVFIGGLFVIRTLTSESPYGRLWKISAGVGLFVFLMSWMQV